MQPNGRQRPGESVEVRPRPVALHTDIEPDRLDASARQAHTPLFSGLLAHIDRHPLQFHIPGHKRGAGMDASFREFMGANALAIDLINIPPVDDLHRPRGIIQEAQSLAAEAFGADRTFFSVEGTSGAVHAAILATCRPGEKVLLPRNVHRSVLTALILGGSRPVFLQPELDREWGIAHGLTTESVAASLDAHEDACALVVVNPTYYGVCSDLQGIVAEAHRRDVPVIVDEAHGAHLGFHPHLPASAMQAGADLAATSVHKLGGSLTQSSILNLREGRVSGDRVQAVFSMLTTTSTSYLLLASLDTARRNLALHGEADLDRAIGLAKAARRDIDAIPGLRCLHRQTIGVSGANFRIDPTKLCISVRELGLRGTDVERLLRDEFNIEIELSDLYNILCVITAADTEQDLERLVEALRSIAGRYAHRPTLPVQLRLPALPVLALSPREAFYASAETVAWPAAVGRIAAESVTVYPPGIPVLMPGEVVTAAHVAAVQAHVVAGLPVQGPEDPDAATLRVVAQTGGRG